MICKHIYQTFERIRFLEMLILFQLSRNWFCHRNFAQISRKVLCVYRKLFVIAFIVDFNGMIYSLGLRYISLLKFKQVSLKLILTNKLYSVPINVDNCLLTCFKNNCYILVCRLEPNPGPLRRAISLLYNKI